MTKTALPLLLNYFLYNLVWLGCIVFQEKFLPVVLIWAIWHMTKIASKAERSIILFVVPLGVLLDSALMQTGIFHFPGHNNELFVPVWLWAIWLGFSLTVYHSASALSRSVIAQILAGALLAPVAYFIGRKFEVVEFGYSDTVTFLTLGIVWAIMLPGIFRFKRLLDTSLGVTDAKANYMASDV